MSTDIDDARDVQKMLGPDDVDRKAFYAAVLGIWRSIRLLLWFILGLEIYGRILQTISVFIPRVIPHF